MSKHTPGPWIFEEAIGDAETGETIWYTVESENGELIAGWCKKDDAALMAAAPSMKKALTDIVMAVGHTTHDHDVEEAILEGFLALKKAKGQTQ